MKTHQALALCAATLLAVTGTTTRSLTAQSGNKPVMTMEGPQGIGLRVEAVPADAPRFEAASIRLDKSGQMASTSQGQLVHVTGARVEAPYITIRELIRNGYNLQHVPRSFIVNGPDWIDGERFNIQAVGAQPFEPQRILNVPPPSAAAMLRSLLADRFKLKAHHETRQMQIYEMVLDRADGKLGTGLKPSTAECVGAFDLVPMETMNRAGQPAVEGRRRFCPFRYSYGPQSFLQTENMSMKDIAMFLGLIVSINRGVVDRTGIEGRFDIEMQFAGDMQLSPTSRPLPREVGAGDLPTLDLALRQQLGLRLRSVRAPVEVLVIDHVERPSEN